MGNKLEQKRAFVRLGIPTARFDAYDGSLSVEDWVENLGRALGPSYVVKWAKQGYDGKGTCMAQASDTRAAIDFAKRATDRGIAVYAEEKISFLRELALLTVHSVTGELAFYPLVQSEQLRGICKWVEGPLAGVSRLEAEACVHAERIAHDQRLHGVFAIEWFETPDGKLLANELAPRVHNSGHFSQDASRTSQFENHCRAVLGLPLGSTSSAQAFAMLNLLAPALKNPHELGEDFSFPLAPEGVHFHWYGKRQLTTDRKIGHLNVAAGSRAELAELKGKMAEFESALNRAILDSAGES
jgi:5-(carboxyamino)imidazole ribonucleotide synthase